MQLIEWLGAVLGIAGALVFSMNQPWSRHAWPIWIASNLLLILFAARIGAWGILFMQGAFIFININGVWRWLVRPRRVAARRETDYTSRRV